MYEGLLTSCDRKQFSLVRPSIHDEYSSGDFGQGINPLHLLFPFTTILVHNSLSSNCHDEHVLLLQQELTDVVLLQQELT
jgi:hypothetical protein